MDEPAHACAVCNAAVAGDDDELWCADCREAPLCADCVPGRRCAAWGCGSTVCPVCAEVNACAWCPADTVQCESCVCAADIACEERQDAHCPAHHAAATEDE